MASGGWPSARFWARSDVRRRWQSLVALGLLAGLTAGLAAAAFAGARRTDTALERLRTESQAADAVVFASQVGVPHPDWSQLRAAPEVADLAVWDLTFGTLDGEPNATLFASQDGAFGERVTRPVITAGRMWDPTAADEVVVSPVLAEQVPLGSTFTFQPFGADQGDEAETPTGPVVTLRVVGVGTTVNRFLFAEDQAFLSPGFVATYGDDVQLAENADVVLHNGAADIPQLQRTVDTAVAPGTPLLDLHDSSRRVDTTLAVERTALLLLSATIAIAGGLLVAQALARSTSALGDDVAALRSMGMSRRALHAAGAASHLPAGVLAVATTAVVAIVVSRWLPVGLARQIDPDPGIHVDLPVVLLACAASALFVVGGTMFFVRAHLRPRRGAVRRPRLTATIRRTAPVTLGLGATLAFDPGLDRARVAVRPALIGAIVGVLGVTAALTVEHAVDDTLAHPDRAGVTWDAIVAPLPSDYGPHSLDPTAVDRIAAAMPAGAKVAEADRIVLPADQVGVPTFTLRPAATEGPPLALGLVTGHAPGDGEAAIGPKTAQDLGVHIGDTITLGESSEPVTIVGEALFPPDVHAEFDEGLWIAPAMFDALVPAVDQADLFEGPERVVIARFASGTDPAAAIEAAGRDLGDSVAIVAPAELPVELTNLRHVRVLPIALAAFVAVVGLAALTYVLVASSRRRRRDFGILRAIGLDRRSTRTIIHVQATAIAAVGLVVGLVLGTVLGRVAWRSISDEVPLQPVSPVAILAMVLIVPITLVVVNVVAVVPARRAARGSPAAALRAE